MTNLLRWTAALVASLVALPACVLQTESVPSPGPWDQVDEGITYVDGFVGIGALAPAYPLEVTGYAKAKGLFVSDTAFLTANGLDTIALFTASQARLTVQPDGTVHIPDTPAMNDLQVDGQAAVTNLLISGVCTGNCTSDGRLKTNVAPLADALPRLLQLRGVTYEWKDQDAHGERERGAQRGFIAQDVAAVFPEWVTDGPDGYKRLHVRGFEALAVEAFRALHDQNRALAARVTALEEANGRLAAEARDARAGSARVTQLSAELSAERRAREKLEARLAALEAAAASRSTRR